MQAEGFPYTLLDVFTDRPLQGNGLAVVHDADGLPGETMLGFARETRLSETTFVQRATGTGAPGGDADAGSADYRNRIWTIAGEVPFAGHPSLGTAVAVASRRGEREARYVQETLSGRQPVEVRLRGRTAQASMIQPRASFGAQADPGEAMRAVGLAPGEAHPQLSPRVGSTGLPFLIVPVARRESVTRAVPRPDALERLLEPVGATGLYLVWADPGGNRAQARMFTRLVAEGEDSGTGSAAGPLCAYLAAGLGWEGLEITQGVEMGRPSLLKAEMVPEGVRVGGDVVILVEGTLTL